MLKEVGPNKIKIKYMQFRDDELGVWWPKFECPICHELFFAYIEDIILGKIWACPKCGKWEPCDLEKKEKQQRKERSIINKMIKQNFLITPEVKKNQKTVENWKLKRILNNNFDSNGERVIADILEKNNIAFVPQYIFENCINKRTNKKLRFDFYLPTYNCCIEYDGKQHFEPMEYFGGEEGFQQQKERDNIKNQYCKNNNILLIRIPFNCKDIQGTILKQIYNEED